jgi:hypothetical protein
MITSLTPIILEAKTSNPDWNVEEFRKLGAKLPTLLENSFFDWDEDAGENWGSLQLSKNLILFLSCKIPVCFIADKWFNTFEQLLGQFTVATIKVHDFDAQTYRIDDKIIEEIAGETPKEINYRQCSIQEIWWATIT